MLLGVFASMALAAAGVIVEGTTTCPRPDEVSERTAALIPVSADAAADRAQIFERDGDVWIRLETPNGELLGERRLPNSSSCDDLAQAFAVSLSTWETDVHPAFPMVLRAPIPIEDRHSGDQPRLAPPSWAIETGVGFGLGTALNDGAAAFDFMIGAWFTPSHAQNKLRIEADVQSRRRAQLSDGQIFWQRSSLSVGIERSLLRLTARSAPGLSWFASARAAWLALGGEGFFPSRSVNAFDPGAAVGLRLSSTGNVWPVWLELCASLWPLGHDATLTGSTDSLRLPTTEGFVRFGAGWDASQR